MLYAEVLQPTSSKVDQIGTEAIRLVSGVVDGVGESTLKTLGHGLFIKSICEDNSSVGNENIPPGSSGERWNPCHHRERVSHPWTRHQWGGQTREGCAQGPLKMNVSKLDIKN